MALLSAALCRPRLFSEMFQYCFRLTACHHGRQRSRVGFSYCLQAPEVLQQPPRGALANAGDLSQFGRAVAHLAALAMKSNGKAVRLVTDLLDQVQHGGVPVEDHGLALLSEHVDD